MKKLIMILVVIAVCGAMVLPAAANEFVPSITYKDHPEIVDKPVIKDEANEEVKDVEVVIKPVSGVLDVPVTDRTENEQILIDVYEKIEQGEVKLPVPDKDEETGEDKQYVVRDLVDITIVDNEGNSKTDVSSVEMTFDLGLKKDEQVIVVVYDKEDDSWKTVDNITYNNNGTVSIVFDKMGPVAFVVEQDKSSDTGDKMVDNMPALTITMVVSGLAIVVLLAFRRKIMN